LRARSKASTTFCAVGGVAIAVMFPPLGGSGNVSNSRMKWR
jgi:hypothetical protein